MPVSLRLGTLLAWLGVCISLLLLQRETSLHSLLCPTKGGCETVLRSQFAELAGLPLPWLGVAFYLVLLALWLAVIAIANPQTRLRLLDGIQWLTVIGLTFSAGLMFVQFGVLHAFCPLCTASACTVAGLLATTWQTTRTLKAKPTDASPGGAVLLALFAAIPTLILAAGSLGQPSSSAHLWMIDLSTAHREGPAEAPVQLIVFSDFQCSFCRQLAPVLQDIHREFPQEVAVVFRHFPLDIHPRAIPAAMAAECAGEQGKFWEYHDKLFAEGGALDDAKLLSLAAALGLDRARFSECLQSDRPRRIVEASLHDAEELGLPGSPMVFLNGRKLEGALTHENLAREITKALRANSRDAGPVR